MTKLEKIDKELDKAREKAAEWQAKDVYKRQESVLTAGPRNRSSRKRPGRRPHSRPYPTGSFSRMVSAG